MIESKYSISAPYIFPSSSVDPSIFQRGDNLCLDIHVRPINQFSLVMFYVALFAFWILYVSGADQFFDHSGRLTCIDHRHPHLFCHGAWGRSFYLSGCVHPRSCRIIPMSCQDSTVNCDDGSNQETWAKWFVEGAFAGQRCFCSRRRTCHLGIMHCINSVWPSGRCGQFRIQAEESVRLTFFFFFSMLLRSVVLFWYICVGLGLCSSVVFSSRYRVGLLVFSCLLCWPAVEDGFCFERRAFLFGAWLGVLTRFELGSDSVGSLSLFGATIPQ